MVRSLVVEVSEQIDNISKSQEDCATHINRLRDISSLKPNIEIRDRKKVKPIVLLRVRRRAET